VKQSKHASNASPHKTKRQKKAATTDANSIEHESGASGYEVDNDQFDEDAANALLQLDNSQGDSKHEDSADCQSRNNIAGRPYSPQEGMLPQTQAGQMRNNQMIEHTIDASNSSDSSSVDEFELPQMRVRMFTS
jgi:hypothetical protein